MRLFMSRHLKSRMIEIPSDVRGDDLIDLSCDPGDHSDPRLFQHGMKQIADPGANDRGRMGFQQDVQAFMQ